MTRRRTDRQLADDIVAKLNSKAAHPAAAANTGAVGGVACGSTASRH
jgi:hypothetical protein